MNAQSKLKTIFGVLGLIGLIIFALVNFGIYLVGGTGWLFVSLGVTGLLALACTIAGTIWYFVIKEEL